MFHGGYMMPWCSVRFPCCVTGSIQVHMGQIKKKQQDIVRSFPLNAQVRCKSDMNKKVKDDELLSF